MDKNTQTEELAQSNLALRRIIGDALEALHHDKNGEFANLPRLIADLKADDKRIKQAHAELIWMELTFEKMHKLLCPGHNGTHVERVEKVFERVLELQAAGEALADTLRKWGSRDWQPQEHIRTALAQWEALKGN